MTQTVGAEHGYLGVVGVQETRAVVAERAIYSAWWSVHLFWCQRFP